MVSSAICGYLVERLPLSSSICHPTSYCNRYSHEYCPEWYWSVWRFSYLLFVVCDVWLCQFFAFGMLDFSCSFSRRGFRFFLCKVSAGGILQVSVATPYSCTKITAAFLILNKIRYSMIFVGNSLHLHTFSLPTYEANVKIKKSSSKLLEKRSSTI